LSDAVSTRPIPAAVPAPTQGLRLSRAEKAERTRARLFQAATEIVGERGYAETSIARITARAEVALGTFYNYFDSRQDILEQLLPAMGEDLLAFIRARLESVDGPVARERARLEAFFDFLVEHPSFYRILNEAEIFAPAGFRRHMDNMVRSYAPVLRTETRSSMREDHIEAVATVLLAARNYLAMRYSYCSGDVRRPPARIIDAYMEFATRGIFA
jgi:AcrR family transcriptional regulator